MSRTNLHRIIFFFILFLSTTYGYHVPIPKTGDMYYGSATVIINNRNMIKQYDILTGQNVFALNYNKSNVKLSKKMSNFTWSQYKQGELTAKGWTWNLVDNSANASWSIDSLTMQCIKGAPSKVVPISELLKNMSYSGSFVLNGKTADIWSQTIDFENSISIYLLQPDPIIELSFPIMFHSSNKQYESDHLFENVVPTTPPDSMFVLPKICS